MQINPNNNVSIKDFKNLDQRGKIQEESIYYETKKHTGEYPIVGVNTFLGSDGSPTIKPKQVIRSSSQEKKNQIKSVKLFQKNHKEDYCESVKILEKAVENNENIFEVIMNISNSQTLGQITAALFQLGGEYRRNM